MIEAVMKIKLDELNLLRIRLKKGDAIVSEVPLKDIETFLEPINDRSFCDHLTALAKGLKFFGDKAPDGKRFTEASVEFVIPITSVDAFIAAKAVTARPN
jgi:hypothetical protein